MAGSFRHRHLFTFLNVWDQNKDGFLTWEDFNIIAENYTKIQRHGKMEKDVYERWKAILEKWWNELTYHADFNKDTYVEFDEWLKFFTKLRETTKTYKELPDFLQNYLQLLFFIVDYNKDSLFDIKDYKMYLKKSDMSEAKAEENFEFMLNEVDKINENTMEADRYRSLVYEYWVSADENCQGKYIYGPFDATPIEELEKKVSAQPPPKKQA